MVSDFQGKYFNLAGLEAEPKSLRRPGPVLINAGTSPAGVEFTAKHIDISFGSVSKPDDIDRPLAIRDKADKKYDRDVGLMCSALVMCRNTEAEARAAYNRIFENGDWEAARNMLSVLGVQSQFFQHGFDERVRRFCAGYGTNPLIGTPEQIVDQLQDYADRGLHGVVLYFENYYDELQYVCERVLPLMKQAGLRH
jgi:alkanesulfonate monooxygenase SsuD/methylene tetrahydromethanopterin reductase-like flavin-dependent oxidoreductase (luciferase family)